MGKKLCVSPRRGVARYAYVRDEDENGKGMETHFTMHEYSSLQKEEVINDVTSDLWGRKLYPSRRDGVILLPSYMLGNGALALGKSVSKSTTLLSAKSKNAYKQMAVALQGINIFQYKLLLMPLCVLNHWVLVLVRFLPNKETNAIECSVFVANSLKSCDRSAIALDLVNVLVNYEFAAQTVESGKLSASDANKWLQENDAKFTLTEAIKVDCPQQSDSINCGLFVLAFCEGILSNFGMDDEIDQHMINTYLPETVDCREYRNRLLAYFVQLVADFKAKNGFLIA